MSFNQEICRDRYLDELVGKRKNGRIKVLTGMHGCGKSYLLRRLFRNALLATGTREGRIVEIALDEPDSRTLRDPKALLAFLQARMQGPGDFVLLLDAVQYLNGCGEVFDSLLRLPNADVFAASSNAGVLAADMPAAVRECCDEIHVFPLLFREYVAECQRPVSMLDYFTHGGLPHVLRPGANLFQDKALEQLLREVFLSGTAVSHASQTGNPSRARTIRNKDDLETLVLALAASVGSCISMNRLAASPEDAIQAGAACPVVHMTTDRRRGKNTLSDKTAKSYVDYLADAFFLFKTERFDIRRQRVLGSPCKYYFEDVGMLNLCQNLAPGVHFLGPKAENLICNELRARGCQVATGILEVQDRGSDGKRQKKLQEISFVASKGGEKYYLQAAIGESEENVQAMRRLLAKIPDSFRKIVVVAGIRDVSWNEDGIATMGLTNFLLDENSLKV